ncbi:MAG TPA: amidohydrolase family protein [Thermoanaerobaculia bacterium]
MGDRFEKRSARVAAVVLAALAAISSGIGLADSSGQSPVRNYKFVNGRWFDGRDFHRKVFYSVGGVFAERAPDRIDETVDLKDGFVVPPFADAHNHAIAGPNNIDKILKHYLTDGIFYAKNPASIRRDTLQIADKINRPDSVDVVFANAGITATGGHPVKLYEQYLNKVKKPGPDGTFENIAYVIIDNPQDLAKKWPAILADHPDFIKGHLLYSEEFEKRRADPAYYGDKGLDPKVLPLLVAKAHESGLRVSCHIETAQDFRNALAAGVDEINHMPGYFPDLKHPDWFPITKEDAEAAARKGVVIVTTTYVVVDEVKKPDEVARMRAIQAANLKLLRDAGVSIAIGPDVYTVTALDEAMNLESLKVFDNRTLLKMWCETSAATIFPKRKIGHLADGDEASFLVLGGNPLERFENVRDIRMRFKQGGFLSVSP